MPKNAPILVECAGRWKNFFFLRSFFDPPAPVVIMCFSIYIRSVFCACQGGPKTCGLSIVLIHCHHLTSRLSFLSFLDFFPVTFRPILVNSTRDFLLLSFNPLPSTQSKIDRIRSMEKTSLTAKLLGRATLILRYYVIRVLRNAVAASNHVVGIECFVETTSASVFFLVFFLALHTDRVKERTVMVMS